MKILNLSIASAFLATSLFLASCTSDPCKDVKCSNSGVATASSDNKSCACKCGSLFEGATCATLAKMKFVKTWSAVDAPGGLIYNGIIAGDTTNQTDLTIANFSGGFFTNNIKATASASTITIAEQKPDPNGNYKVRGTGTFSANEIKWSYTILQISPADSNSYTGTWK